MVARYAVKSGYLSADQDSSVGLDGNRENAETAAADTCSVVGDKSRIACAVGVEPRNSIGSCAAQIVKSAADHDLPVGFNGNRARRTVKTRAEIRVKTCV